MTEDPSPTRRAKTFRGDRNVWLLLLVVVACGLGVFKYTLHRRVVDDPDPERGVSTDARVSILAYDRIVDEVDGIHVERERFQSHMEALRADGFVPVTLGEVERFYYEGKKLPAKPILITFDFGYLATYANVDAILRDMKWHAVTFLVTTRQEQRDTHFLYWDRLRRMVDSGVWEIGANGHLGRTAVPVDRDGTKGSFLSRRMWLQGEQRQESIKEYEERVAGDLNRSKTFIEANLEGISVRAYASPSRRTQWSEENAELHSLQQQVRAKHYTLGFEDDRFGVNGSSSNPLRLRRFRVPVDWSAAQLIDYLNVCRVTPPVEGHPGEKPSETRWIAGEGTLQAAEGKLRLRGSPRADLWFPGSQWLKDWVLEADVVVSSGEFWVRRESSIPGTEWRVGGREGAMSVQYRAKGHRFRTLVNFGDHIVPGQRHHLRIVKRGRGVWIEWDEQAVSELPVFLPGEWTGPVTCVAWATEGVAETTLENLRLSRFSFTTATLPGDPSTRDVQELIAQASRLGGASPIWLDVDCDRVVEQRVNTDLFRVLRHRYGFEIIPVVILRSDSPGPCGKSLIDIVEETWLPRFLERVASEGWGGLCLDTTRLTDQARSAVAGVHSVIQREFRAKGLRLVLRDDEEDETTLEYRSQSFRPLVQ